MAGAGNSAGTSNNAGNLAGVKPPVVCRRWRELSRLLLGNYGRVLQRGNVMGYEMQLNDPVFFDDTWYVQCKVCEGEYDRNTYNSDTCEGCENKQVEASK
jgi:hypothetical protein